MGTTSPPDGETTAAATMRTLHLGAGGAVTHGAGAGDALQVCTVELGDAVLDVPALPDHLLAVTLSGRHSGVASIAGLDGPLAVSDSPGSLSLLPAGRSARIRVGGRTTRLQLLIGRHVVARAGTRTLRDARTSPDLVPFGSLFDPLVERRAVRLAARLRLAPGPTPPEDMASLERLCEDLIVGYALDPLVPTAGDAPRLAGLRLMHVLERIDASIDEDPRSETLARSAGFPSDGFAAAFECATAQSIDAYVAQRRVDRACEWLDGLAANDVLDRAALERLAATVGLADARALTSAFLAQRGRTPRGHLEERRRSSRPAGDEPQR